MSKNKIVENFTLKDQSGNTFDLYKNLDKKVLLVFYPKDDTPVCSTQLSDYNSNLGLFTANNIKVVGINSNSLEDHKKFCNKISITIPLLSDADKKVSSKFGALNPLRFTKRKLVLIGVNKEILYQRTILPFRFVSTEEIISDLKLLNYFN